MDYFKILLLKFIQKIKSRLVCKNNHGALNQVVARRKYFSAGNVKVCSAAIAEDEWPLLTISVVTYNSKKWLSTFISSLESQNYPCCKIVLFFVDNGSNDGTWELLSDLKSLHHKFRKIECVRQENLGYGAGHDVALRRSSTKFVLVTNIDILYLPDSITNLVSEAVRSDKDIATWEARQIPYEHPKHYDPVSLETRWSSHACILIDRKKYIDVGGYEKKIFMYGEDVELSYRFVDRGYFLKYVPKACVIHHTYEQPGEVKALQFSGSLLANLYIRMRFGCWQDVLHGWLLQSALLLKDIGVKDSKQIVKKNLRTALINAPHFLFKKKNKVQHAFYNFDYEMNRFGAFHESTPLSGKSLPLVTVITRTVAGREYLLRECISSVMNQTYPNIEHVIVQDGGNSAKNIVDSVRDCFFSNHAYSIRFLEAPSRGRSHAGNLGLKKANGDFLLFLDDDDLLYADHIETLYSAVVKNQTAAAYSLAWEVLTKMHDTYYTEELYQTLPLFHQRFDIATLFHHNYLPIQSILFSRNYYDLAGGFEEDLTYLEDWVLWCKYALISDFHFVPKTTSLYRTPADPDVRHQRSIELNKALPVAEARIEKNRLKYEMVRDKKCA